MDGPETGTRTEDLEEFVQRFYDARDIMHGWGHIQRVLRLARRLAEAYAGRVNESLLVGGAYLHGGIWSHQAEIEEFLRSQGLAEDWIAAAVRTAWDSQTSGNPESLEGTILHDAHLIEGGRTFIITKSLITGSLRGQSLEESIAYMEENILGRFTCYLPEAQEAYRAKEAFAREFLDDLKRSL